MEQASACDHEIIATKRHPEPGSKFIPFDSANPTRLEIPEGARVLYSIPFVEPEVLASFSRPPERIVYLSTTGVYGATRDVDENTPPAPDTESAKQRIDSERLIQSAPWSSLILRPAAIYGPDRGIHIAMRTGRFQLAGEGTNYVSRIHVDDLAAHCLKALYSDLTGAYPVADDHPCTSREIAEYCAKIFNLPMPPSAPPDRLHETRRADRRVNGKAIRKLLGITLRYPTYREGLSM